MYFQGSIEVVKDFSFEKFMEWTFSFKNFYDADFLATLSGMTKDIQTAKHVPAELGLDGNAISLINTLTYVLQQEKKRLVSQSKEFAKKYDEVVAEHGEEAIRAWLAEHRPLMLKAHDEAVARSKPIEALAVAS